LSPRNYGRLSAHARHLFHCSIRQRPEVGEDLRRFRRIHHAL